MDRERPERYFVEHPRIAWNVILSGLLLFAITTYSVLTESFLFKYDQPLLQQLTELRNESPQWVRSVIDVVDKLGNGGTAIIGTALGIYWLWKVRMRKFYLLLASLLGNAWFFMALIYLFDRARPHPMELLGLGLILLPSYPSGHVMAAIGLYAMLLYVYLPRLTSSAWQVLLFLGAGALVLLIGFLRLYEGAHYLTDVIGGLGIGVAWSAFALMLVDRYLNDQAKGE